MDINYDNIANVLYISFGKPEPCVAEEIGNGGFIRRSIQDNEITGITILDFNARLNQGEEDGYLRYV